ncbi:hypothetical protein CAPTEDRAFT_216837 [Capitella teleta]|uniref:LRRCT domain-containing protein n=1 Tax=Capitella teleta TaxID=283909 RepID=R7V0F4_CAPTE|nr:hypothetical protein CAPTEDRAFT_216837 [Capitella teleta]|eukprot:ELU09151.1 hypothetical protein CAPTEDRAFT_216837 [Capitella teleta]
MNSGIYCMLWIVTWLPGQLTQNIADSSNQGLKQIPESNFAVNVTKITLASNQLSVIVDGAFSKYNHLDNVDLSDNTITEIGALAFNNTILKILKLSKNLLSSLPNLVCVKDTLQILSVWQNNISTIDTISSLVNLVKLNLNSNSLTYIKSELFHNLSSLETLLLRNNKLTTIGNLGQPSRTLTTVDFEHMDFTCDRELCWMLALNYSAIVGTCNSPAEYNGTDINVAVYLMDCYAISKNIQMRCTNRGKKENH